MKKFWETLLFVLIVSCLFLLKPRQDILVAAIDENQYIRLFEEGQDFELCIDENNLFTGTYSISTDTVSLYYLEHLNSSTNKRKSITLDFSTNLPLQLFIDKVTSTIQSSDGTSFSARIYTDTRSETNYHIIYSQAKLDFQAFR